LLKLAPVLARFADPPDAVELTEPTAALLRSLGADPLDPRLALGRVAATTPDLMPFLTAALSVTFAPTMARASEKINVIPSRASVNVDCRTPPGIGEEVVRQRLAELLGPLSRTVDIDLTERELGNYSPLDSPLMHAIRHWISTNHPEAEAVPVILTGFADSRVFRDAFPDCITYGFFPQRHQTMVEAEPLIHGDNERIDLRDLCLATRFYADLAMGVLGTAES
jgi:acetylornithine deacetylase/succinyl-diaminopimelate desuccinylase-like protein